MNTITKFLTDNPTFYLATMEGDQPRVRPFGAVCEFEGRIYFCTNNTKPVFKQIQANPKVEISTTSPEGEWIRLCGNAVIDTRTETKEAMLKANPALKDMYSASDDIFEVFYIKDGTATFQSFTGKNEKVVL